MENLKKILVFYQDERKMPQKNAALAVFSGFRSLYVCEVASGFFHTFLLCGSVDERTPKNLPT